jgi:hypothetical protein
MHKRNMPPHSVLPAVKSRGIGKKPGPDSRKPPD